MLRAAPLSAALLLASASLAAPADAGPPLYPTDACVSAKLTAAGRYCERAVQEAVRGVDLGEAPFASLERAWARAEAAASTAGVSCEETTASAAEMADLLDAGAAEIAAAGGGTRVARSRAGLACQRLLAAEGRHLRQRSLDRSRAQLDAQRAVALAPLSRQPGLADVVEGVADDARLAALVSPAVSTEWTMVTPPEQVAYGDETLEPICSRGTPWVHFVKRGTVNKLIVYYQGGGACWNYLTCGPFFPTFKQTAGPSDNPANATTGFANLANPENPFKDWNAVFVPYCTGDVHWGDAVVTHELSGDSTTIHHKGFVNAQVAEKWAREHFVNPDQVFVTGSSAGSYGAVVNALSLKEHAYPSTPFAVVGDGGNGIITRDFLENDLAKWGIEDNLPDWIPGLDQPLTNLVASDLWIEPAKFYPDSRFANYSTAYDGGTGGQVGFYNIMLSDLDIAQWVQWWRPSCEWNEQMRALVQQSAAEAPDNYRYYIGTGSRHTMWGNDKVYTDTTGGVPTIVSWLQAMLDGTPAWTNVECSDCGLLLPGDPRPPATAPQPTPPYEGDRVVCEE